MSVPSCILKDSHGPYTLNPEHQTITPNPESLNPEHQTITPNPETYTLTPNQLDKAHFIVDEMLANGFVVETNKNIVLEPLNALDK